MCDPLFHVAARDGRRINLQLVGVVAWLARVVKTDNKASLACMFDVCEEFHARRVLTTWSRKSTMVATSRKGTRCCKKSLFVFLFHCQDLMEDFVVKVREGIFIMGSKDKEKSTDHVAIESAHPSGFWRM